MYVLYIYVLYIYVSYIYIICIYIFTNICIIQNRVLLSIIKGVPFLTIHDGEMVSWGLSSSRTGIRSTKQSNDCSRPRLQIWVCSSICQRTENRARKTNVFENVLARYYITSCFARTIFNYVTKFSNHLHGVGWGGVGY